MKLVINDLLWQVVRYDHSFNSGQINVRTDKHVHYVYLKPEIAWIILVCKLDAVLHVQVTHSKTSKMIFQISKFPFLWADAQYSQWW